MLSNNIKSGRAFTLGVSELDASLVDKRQELADCEDKLAALHCAIQSEGEAIEKKQAEINQKSQMLII